MTYLSLREVNSGTVREFELPEVRLGRDPECEWPIVGDGAEVVSGHHARFFVRDGKWWVEDVGSRNGTSLNDRHISRGQAESVSVGAVVALGERGPRFRVEATEKRRIAATVIEPARAVRPSAPTMPMQALEDRTLPMQGLPATPPAPPGHAAPARAAAPQAAPPGPAAPLGPPPPPPAPPSLKIVVRDTRSGDRFEAKGGRVRIGRGDECELRPVATGDTSVSRVHAEIVLLPDGRAVLRDAKSRNGTLVNDQLLVGDHPLKQGERVKLGEGGPDLMVEELLLPGAKPEPVKPAAPPAAQASVPAEVLAARRSFAGKGKTVFFREMMEETTQKSAKKLRWVIWSFVVLLVGAAGGFYWYSEQQARQTASELEQQRRALAVASERTEALEGALRRAEAAMTQQLAAGDSAQRAAQGELSRLRAELGRELSRATDPDAQSSKAALDSLRAAIREQERRNAAISAQMRAVKGVNLAAIAQASGAAVGLVTGYEGKDVWDGSGFVVTPSGHFVTNRHVATAEGRPADSLFVTLADQREKLRADVVGLPREDTPDLAVLKIRSYNGPAVTRVDWSGTRVRQGEPAALIGYPAGYYMAFDRTTGTVKTSMSAGIFAQVTSDGIRFNGFTVGGSSGSPIFNADGEVVAVHRAGLKESLAEGQREYSFAVPVRLLIPLLPSDARLALGLR